MYHCELFLKSLPISYLTIGATEHPGYSHLEPPEVVEVSENWLNPYKHLLKHLGLLPRQVSRTDRSGQLPMQPQLTTAYLS